VLAVFASSLDRDDPLGGLSIGEQPQSKQQFWRGPGVGGVGRAVRDGPARGARAHVALHLVEPIDEPRPRRVARLHLSPIPI